MSTTETYRPCPGHARHWFVFRKTGVRTPTCQRCNAPNPKWSETRDRENYESVKHPAEWEHRDCPVCGSDAMVLVHHDGRAVFMRHEIGDTDEKCKFRGVEGESNEQ